MNLCSSKYKGFTLIEVMVVIAIIAIIAAIAIPSYNEQVLRGRRSEGIAIIMETASRQERFYTQNATYAKDFSANELNTGDTSDSGFYVVTFQDVVSSDNNANCGVATEDEFVPCTQFTLVATPQFADAQCGNLTLSSQGVKGVSVVGDDDSDEASAIIDRCWR